MSIIHRLRDLYPAPQWAFFTEVRSATGSNVEDLRIADGIAVNTFPSGGLEIHGFELKVSRSDFLVELRQPDKAKRISRFCSRWSLVVPAPRKLIVSSLSELPRGWGLIEIGTGAPVTIVEAEKKQAVELDVDFIRSLLRAGSMQGAAGVDVGAPMVAISRPDLSRTRVGLACGHAAPRPLEKKLPARVPCFACLDGAAAEVEVVEGMLEDASDEDLLRVAEIIDRQKRARGIEEVA